MIVINYRTHQFQNSKQILNRNEIIDYSNNLEYTSETLFEIICMVFVLKNIGLILGWR